MNQSTNSSSRLSGQNSTRLGIPFRWETQLLLITITVLLTSLTASADGPAPPSGGLPSAGRLQQLHDLGQQLGINSYDAETIGPALPRKSNLEYHLDNYMKDKGAGLSKTEREVFTEAFWKGVGDATTGLGKIEPPTIDVAPPSATSTTTTLSGKTPTAEPGTLQLTDKDGNSYFVDVDSNGNYKKTIPQANFQPVKATLWTKNGKLKRIVKSDGTWVPVSSAAGTGTQGAMAPDKANATQQVAYLEECKQHGMIGSLDQDSFPVVTRSTLWLRPVRLMGPWRAREGRSGDPLLRLVSEPLSPDAIRAAQELGITHADQEFEKSELEKIPEGSRTQAQTNRLNNLKKMIQEYKDGQTAIRKAAENNTFVDVRPADIAEQAAQARRLQRQAQQMRASGQGPQADSLEKTAQTLYGGPLPPLHAGTAGSATGASGRVGGRAVDPGQKPIGWSMVAGAVIFPRENPGSLDDPKVDKQLRDEPVDGCTPFDTTDGEGKFKLRLEYRLRDNFRLDQYYYKPTVPTDTDTRKIQPEPTTPKTPAGQSSTQGAFYRTGVGAPENCSYAYTDSFTPQMGLTYSKKAWTLDVGKVTLNPELGYNFQMTNSTDIGALRGALNAGAIAPTDLTLDFHQADGIAGIGHLQTGWQNAQAFQLKIPDHVVHLEEDTCSQIALAPSWDPAHWPAQSPAALPLLHVEMNDLYE